MTRAARRNTLFVLVLLVFGAIAGFGGYYAGGRADALHHARFLHRKADELLAQGRDGPGLGPGREAMLLAVESPSSGTIPTLTRSLARRFAFDPSEDSLAWIRHSGYASGLDTALTDPQIVALWLETVEMGKGPDGWMTGFYQTSEAVYGRMQSQLTDEEFLRLLAVVAAPSRFDLQGRDPALEARVARLRRLVAGLCRSAGKGDVWLRRCTAD